MQRLPSIALCVALSCLAGCSDTSVVGRRVLLGTTHTLEDSGLLVRLTTAFHAAEPELTLSVVVAGSGEILTLAARGDLDVLLTHSPEDELAFMASGRGESRDPVMHNDFVLLGPPADPARTGGAPDVLEALRRIREAGTPFVSRGDDSGTHRRELALRAAAGAAAGGRGYIEAGTGMADVLRLASQRGAYVLADRATFEVLRQQLQLEIMQEHSPGMQNEYSVIVVEGATNAGGARAFAEWVRSPDVQELIEELGRTADDRPLFVRGPADER